LGLGRNPTQTFRTSAGIVRFDICDPVRLTVEGLDGMVEVVEIPNDCRVLIGRLPLMVSDFVVDPSGRELIGNPDRGGKRMIDVFQQRQEKIVRR
jgi:hypothetical protein